MWLLEHPLVVTTGRRDPGDLSPVQAPIVRTERGGLATVHCPGQVVGYLLLNLFERGLGVKRAVCAIEAGMIAWLAQHEVQATRRTGFPGVWAQGDKIGAVGLHVRRGVTMHGFALNLDPDLNAFSSIVPCGIRDAGVTSIRRLTGVAPSPHQVAEDLGRAVLAAFVDTAGARR